MIGLDTFFDELRVHLDDSKILASAAKKKDGVWELRHDNGIVLLQACQSSDKIYLLWETLSFASGTWIVGKLATTLMEAGNSFTAQRCRVEETLDAFHAAQSIA